MKVGLLTDSLSSVLRNRFRNQVFPVLPGEPIQNECTKDMRKKRDLRVQGKTVYDMASDCLKKNSILDPALKELMGLLKSLTRGIQHLYKRLPNE